MKPIQKTLQNQKSITKEFNVGESATVNRVHVHGVALKGCVAGRTGKETDVMEA